MKQLKKLMTLSLAWGLFLTRTVLANENVKTSSILSEGEVYLKAFYAAVVTLLVMLIIWIIIFRPRFKSSDDSF